jgi:hypothetical protein
MKAASDARARHPAIKETTIVTIKFDIRHRSGEHESVRVEGERALVGSAAFCDVRLPVGAVAPEHVLVSASGQRVRVEAKAAEPLVLVDGTPLAVGAHVEGSVLVIGRTRIALSIDAHLDPARASKKRSRFENTVSAAALVGLLGGAAWLLLQPSREPIAPPPDASLELFSGPPPSCPQHGAREAAAFAEEQLALAVAKRERLPFAVQEGIAAFDLYETASACFRAGGDERRAGAARDEAQRIQTSLTDEFRGRRLRLSHMLKLEDYELARVDVIVLTALTRGRKGKYVEWLQTVAAQLPQQRKNKS